MVVVLLKKEEYNRYFMINITNLETYINKEKQYYGSFLIEPLEIGQGITIGNTIRRILLSNITSFAITGVRINNLKHEFSNIEGIREDILEILLNLKAIIFQSTLLYKNNHFKYKGFLHIKGPCIITAGMFNLPKNSLKIINPNQYIGTIVTSTEIYIEIDVENNTNYNINNEVKNIKNYELNQPITLHLDSIYTPILNVNYKIKLIYDNNGYIKESLILNILTNGSITPNRAIQESLKIILGLFYPLLINSNFIKIFSKKE